ncbi:hypothetical protein HW115_09510 [Verrucomicrobiaceae bacterium N1E253]|uniref:Uncharacterized protein n=1 Tax=Oceaniferula marina TaxID=2748318 RepID=A0A851GL86_9BACT|nr:hypothetical protein [Oceaniferula marina]NWK55847.1 hypothetical protein [Oceaniferula marina]
MKKRKPDWDYAVYMITIDRKDSCCKLEKRRWKINGYLGNVKSERFFVPEYDGFSSLKNQSSSNNEQG